MGVRTAPGSISTTLIPAGANSWRRDSAMASRANLDESYGASSGVDIPRRRGSEAPAILVAPHAGKDVPTAIGEAQCTRLPDSGRGATDEHGTAPHRRSMARPRRFGQGSPSVLHGECMTCHRSGGNAPERP